MILDFLFKKKPIRKMIKNPLKSQEILVDKTPFLKKKNNNKCSNKLTKKQFNRNNAILINKDYNGLCICCGKPIKNSNLDCNECPNGHKIHKSCKIYLETNLINNEFCPICGLIIKEKLCESKINNKGGKTKKRKTMKKRQSKY